MEPIEQLQNKLKQYTAEIELLRHRGIGWYSQKFVLKLNSDFYRYG